MAGINRGPLTTIFTPPSECASQASNVYWSPVGEKGKYWMQGPVDLGICWPTRYLGETTEYYSPGRCPSGYKPACSRLNSIGTVTETIQTCFPTAYSYSCRSSDSIGYGACMSDLGSTLWTMTSVYVITSGYTISIGSTTGTIGAVNVLGVQVRFQSTDFLTATPTRTSLSATATVTRVTGLTTSSTSSPSHLFSTSLSNVLFRTESPSPRVPHSTKRAVSALVRGLESV
ncbi:hypothetical protein GGS26DRAFT_560464 [Hypomontagnella submonticulosa]|nr:hypothetical protein GGS26DRAFT_560464 [Hypomontagnella submonticulosa]